MSQCEMEVPFKPDLQAILRRLQACSEELRDLYQLLESLQPKPETQGREKASWCEAYYNKCGRVFYNSNRKNSRVKAGKYCNWCGRVGHVEEECWGKEEVWSP